MAEMEVIPSADDKPVKLHGITFPSVDMVMNIWQAILYMPQDEDIVLVSYPNAGKDWLRHVVLHVVGMNDYYYDRNISFKMVPILERTGVGVLSKLYDPRIYGHSLPYYMVRKNPMCKYIYIYRNPEDTFASFYYHLCRRLRKKVSLEQAFNMFLTGKDMEFGRYFEHARSYISCQHRPNLLLVSYDKLYHCPEEEILRISEFLDEEYYAELVQSDEELNDMVEITSCENVERDFLPIDSDCEDVPMIDSGPEIDPEKPIVVVGGGKRLLSRIQIQKLHQTAAEVLGGMNLLTQHLQYTGDTYLMPPPPRLLTPPDNPIPPRQASPHFKPTIVKVVNKDGDNLENKHKAIKVVNNSADNHSNNNNKVLKVVNNGGDNLDNKHKVLKVVNNGGDNLDNKHKAIKVVNNGAGNNLNHKAVMVVNNGAGNNLNHKAVKVVNNGGDNLENEQKAIKVVNSADNHSNNLINKAVKDVNNGDANNLYNKAPLRQ